MSDQLSLSDQLRGFSLGGLHNGPCKYRPCTFCDAADEIERLNRALKDIEEWCLNAHAKTGIKPYGLGVAQSALNRCGTASNE